MQGIELTVEIELETEQIAKLFEDEFGDRCPVCKNVPINDDEKICCECFRQALEYHINTCGCYPP